MTELLQKAVLPGRESAWVGGDDLLCGFVVRAADAAWAKTPRQLFDVHGLGFPGSPFTAESTAVDVLRFPASPYARLINATGAPVGADVEPMGEGFIEHAPFTGNGFAAGSENHIVPVWWLEPMRVPAGSELWRIHSDGREEFLSVYANVASGWQPAPTPRIGASDVFGVFAEWRGVQVLADPLPDGGVVIASFAEQPGLKLTERGLWAGRIDASEVTTPFALKLTGLWRQLPFQIVRRWQQDGALYARGVYMGRDSRAAEAAGLEKTDAAVYEATLPLAELTDIQGVQLVPSGA
ncbi:hypothetical protein [Microbacterium aurantiacum]|uniref:Uncharacterized protein n=1 Tax=Microbacterium aurantiacum TaxID=162393 RepID=A0A0M8MK10_9MICO|nr:hypothetical protein [Microbacterium chocolatum]ANG84390.1 hypothetical protein A8L33_02415 [Microbacterium chocolatum]KOS11677.1 hypothetical protein XI38_03790 [Microbacterium chocolatum]